MAFLWMSEGDAAEGHRAESGKIEEIEAARILPNPAQPRKDFDTEALLALSESIRRHGILQPPVVRRLPDGEHYELIAGERRLRAACMAGLYLLPCLVRESDENESAELAMIENLQRRDLGMFEEAAALSALSERFHLTQEQIASRLSVSQSYVANKLRLLRFSARERAVIGEGGLTERHARAILRLPDPAIRIQVIRHIKAERLNVAKTEQLVEELSSNSAQTAKKPPVAQESASALSPPVLITPRQPNGFCPNKLAIADLTPIYNSIERVLSIFRKTGATASCTTEEGTNGAKITIDISK